MTRKLIAAGLAVALLAGCALPEETPEPEPTGPVQAIVGRPDGEITVTTVQVGDREVTCIVWSDYKRGGLSCDWTPDGE